MKVYQIISESKEIDEAPAGMLSRLGTAVKSKIPGEIGQRAKGTQVSNREANAVKKELVSWMGTARIPKNQLTVDQLMTFMNQKGYGGKATKDAVKAVKPGVRKNDPISGKEVDSIIMQAIGNTVKTQGTNVGRGALAGPAPKKGGTFKSSRNKGIPSNITSAVSKMTPQQKQALAQMLQGGTP